MRQHSKQHEPRHSGKKKRERSAQTASVTSDIPPVDRVDAPDDGASTRPCLDVAPEKTHIPEFFPATGPVRVALVGDYTTTGSMVTGIPFWGDDSLSRVLFSAFHGVGFCDDFSLHASGQKASALKKGRIVPSLCGVAMTFVAGSSVDWPLDEVASRRSQDRLRGFVERAAERSAGQLRVVALGGVARFVMRSILFDRVPSIELVAIQHPGKGLSGPGFHEQDWINWAIDSMRA